MPREQLDKKAKELVKELQALADLGTRKPPTMLGVGNALVQSADEVVINQLEKFSELLLILARKLDRAQKPIQWLTLVILALTVVIAVDAVIRIYHSVAPN